MIIHGDCLRELKGLADNSVDSVVTDPPYGLSFMGKKWDYEVPSIEIWRECLRVLKPGGHLLSFAGTRTYHRMACNIEDAGFEIRDQIMWLYGSGFPKSQNVSIQIDKQAGAIGHRGKAFQTAGAGERKDIQGTTGAEAFETHKPVTEEAKQWQGWGTALKPANEPIVVARKPLEKGLTVAQNVLKYGTGALNIDASRVGTEVIAQHQRDLSQAHGDKWAAGTKQPVLGITNYTVGRWPANVLLDEESSASLDLQVGDNVSRFFYVAKASKRERGEGNVHPTVKPVKLMEYLIKLVTPPLGKVLDPFAGSGTTLLAAVKNDFEFIGIEREAEYVQIIRGRVKAEQLAKAEGQS